MILSAITIALGQSDQMSDRVEYWVETLVHYEMINKSAFSRINLSK